MHTHQSESTLHALAGVVYRGAVEAHRVFVASGWCRSRLAWRAQDAAGNPLPWLSYPAIAWLQSSVRPEWRVCEYGAGQSTLWFAERCHVRSVEYEPEWAEYVADKANVIVKRVATESAYASFAESSDTLAIIDGYPNEWRTACARHCARVLPGMVMLDNAEHFPEAREILAAAYGHVIPFAGLAPGTPVQETTLFIKAR